MFKHHTISHELFTTISLTSVILPLYGFADECRQLMTQLRSKSRKLWNSDMDKWFKVLSCVKRTMKINADSNITFEMLCQNYLYAMVKLEVDVEYAKDLDNLANFIQNCGNKKLVEITWINLDPHLKKQDLKSKISEFLESIELEREIKEFNAWNKVKFVSLPLPFRFKEVSHVIDKTERYIIDYRITELPTGFELSKVKDELLNNEVNEIEIEFKVPENSYFTTNQKK